MVSTHYIQFTLEYPDTSSQTLNFTLNQHKNNQMSHNFTLWEKSLPQHIWQRRSWKGNQRCIKEHNLKSILRVQGIAFVKWHKWKWNKNQLIFIFMIKVPKIIAPSNILSFYCRSPHKLLFSLAKYIMGKERSVHNMMSKTLVK